MKRIHFYHISLLTFVMTGPIAGNAQSILMYTRNRFDGGRQFYTALGHDTRHYQDVFFLEIPPGWNSMDTIKE